MAVNTDGTKCLQVVDDETTEEWSDLMCMKIGRKDQFPAIVKDISVQKSIINRFLNFYLSGKVQKGLNVKDIIFAVIAIIPQSIKTEEVIWHDNNYSENGNLLFLSPEDKLKIEIKNILTHQKPHSEDQNEKNQDMQNNETKEIQKNLVDELNVKNEEYIDCDKVSTPDQDTDHDKEIAVNKNNDTHNNTSSEISYLTDYFKNQSPLDTMNWYRKKRIQPNNIESIEYGPIENAAFCISCNKLLDQWHSDVSARIYLKYFFGFVALSLMRTVAKSYQNVIKMFLTTFRRIVALSTDRIKYSPPSNTCVIKSFKTLRQQDHKTQIMFSKIVITSFLKNPSLEDTEGVPIMLKIAVLSHLAHFGMGIIAMLQEIASESISFSAVFDSLYSEETSSSWNKVNDFLKKYVVQSAGQKTYHWARVIDSKQFQQLSCENNFPLAVVIAVFVEKICSNEGIWNARWVKSGNNLETYKILGRKLYEDYNKKQESFLISLLGL